MEACSKEFNKRLSEYNVMPMPAGVYPTQAEFNNFVRIAQAYRKTGQNPSAYLNVLEPERLSPLMDWSEKVIRVYEHVQERIWKQGVIPESEYPAVVEDAFRSVWPTYESWERQFKEVKQVKSSLAPASASCGDNSEVCSRVLLLY